VSEFSPFSFYKCNCERWGRITRIILNKTGGIPFGSVEKIKNHSIFVGATLAVALWNRILERAGARPAPTFAFFNTPFYQTLP
jgi:hypothetical protein